MFSTNASMTGLRVALLLVCGCLVASAPSRLPRSRTRARRTSFRIDHYLGKEASVQITMAETLGVAGRPRPRE